MASPHDLQDDAVNVLDLKLISPADFRIGQVSAACGRAAYGYIIRAIEMAKSGEVAGVVTNPINKEALKAAGIDYPGHTEIFAHETGVTDYSMMFMLENVAVVHVTTHCSLRQAIELITRDRVLSNIRLLHKTLRRLGVDKPRIAVGGLNPHAGENGLFGDEEIRHVSPAVAAAVKDGMDARGPFPPDTVFMRAFRGEFDGIVSMLHDHGFVALKTRNFDGGVNITVGLPIIRTSVGHGTAFDIAGKGIASEKSLLAAISAAERLSFHEHGAPPRIVEGNDG
jgi:4-hydroxythreonine-4-phosphate dehydrogenase